MSAKHRLQSKWDDAQADFQESSLNIFVFFIRCFLNSMDDIVTVSFCLSVILHLKPQDQILANQIR